MKLSKTNSRHCKRRLTWYVKHEYTLYRTSSLFTYCIIWWMPWGPMASPWLWGVIAIATWWSWWWSAPWEGPVQSSCYCASCSSTGYAGRTKGGRWHCAFCRNCRHTTDIARHTHGAALVRSCACACVLCVWMHQEAACVGIPWVSFTLLVSIASPCPTSPQAGQCGKMNPRNMLHCTWEVVCGETHRTQG